MKYRTFSRIRSILIIGAVFFTCWGIYRLATSKSEKPQVAAVQRPAHFSPPPARAPALPAAVIPRPVVDVNAIKAQLDSWLTTHADRQGQMKRMDVLPDALFRATVIRFKSPDAEKFTSDQRHWSQIRLDLNRDGIDDEKWLLKDGQTYKREVLTPDGKTSVQTFYFNQPAPAAAVVQAPATNSIKDQLEAWLANNQDRYGQMKLVNVLSGASFRATAIRFPDADAAKFSSDPRNWSQIRLDLDRNGVDDEKWLIKNGRFSKREVLGPDGKTTVNTEYFK